MTGRGWRLRYGYRTSARGWIRTWCRRLSVAAYLAKVDGTCRSHVDRLLVQIGEYLSTNYVGNEDKNCFRLSVLSRGLPEKILEQWYLRQARDSG